VRVGLISLIAIVGCVATVGAAPRSADDKVLPSADAQKAVNETLITRPIVPLDQLIDQTPDGSLVVELYQTVRTVRDVEAANENVKAQVIKAQSIAANVARLHAASFKSCDVSAPQIETIANKARGFSTTLVRVDSELTKSLATMRQKIEREKPGSTRAREDVNRLVLAAHELGRLRVQAQEIAKSVEGLGVSIRTTAASCTPTPVPPLFAERDAPSTIGTPASRSPLLSPKRAAKPATTPARRFSW
jgi:Spy/CpxP family protein refolding chaperone